LKNPIVYLLSEESEEIIQNTKRTLPEDAVFIIQSPAAVTEAIKKIQANPAKLNLTRVNIYALNTPPAEATELRKAFVKNFHTVNLTLTSTTSNILKTLSESDNPYDQIFVLTPKNEFGEILPTAHQTISETIAALPLLHTTHSTFNEAISTRMKEKITLSSAGFWQPPPSQIEENLALHKLAGEMEEELLRPWGLSPQYPHKPLKRLDPNFDICGCIAGVAARPLRFWDLVGKTLLEAENLLFGEEAKKFFVKNFFGEVDAHREEGVSLETMALNEVAVREKHLREAIETMAQQAHHLTEALQKAESTVVKITHSVNYVKTKIGEAYVIRHQLQQTKVAQSYLTTQHTRLQNHLTATREKIKAYKALPTEAPSIPLGEAPISISLLRDDALLREDHTIKNAKGELCRLRLVGGFGLNDFQV